MRMAILVRIMMLTIIIIKSLENSLNLWVLILMLQKMEHGCNYSTPKKYRILLTTGL